MIPLLLSVYVNNNFEPSFYNRLMLDRFIGFFSNFYVKEKAFFFFINFIVRNQFKLFFI